MAHTVQLSDGTNSVSLVYASGSQEDYRLRYMRQRRDLGPEPVMHRSDASDNGPEPVRSNRDNREWYCTLTLKGTSRDDLHNNMHTLERLCKQATDSRTYHPIGSVYLHIQPDSATNWTRYDVKLAHVVDDSGFWEPPATSTDSTLYARPIVVLIITEPIGYGAIETLKNYLDTPHFEEDGDDDGLADNWNELDNPTTTLDTDIYLCGSQSQKVVTDASTSQGIYSDNITVTGGEYVVASVWLYKASGDAVTMRISSSGGSIDTVTTAATADATETVRGVTWERYDLAGTAHEDATTLYMTVWRSSTGASAATTFYVDKCYIGLSSNIVTNGGFETAGAGDPDFWGTWTESAGDGALANETANQYDGSDAMKATAGASTNTYAYNTITVEPGESYTLRFYTRGDGTYGGRYRVYDATNAAYISGVENTGVTGTDYAEVEYSFTAPSTPKECISVRIYLHCPATNTGIAYFDSVSVTKDLTLPTAWASHYIITNHYDTGASHVNYIDVTDVPGDEAALTRVYNETEDAWGDYPMYLYWGSHDNDPGSPSDYLQQYSAAGAGDRLYTSTAVAATTWTNVGQKVVTGDALKGEYIVLAIVNDRSASAGGQIRAKVIWGSSAIGLSTYYYTDPVTLPDNQVWAVEALGPINFSWPDFLDSGLFTRQMIVDIEAYHADATNFYVDQIHLFPVHGGLSISALDAVNGNDARIYLDRMSERDGSRCAVYEPGATMRMIQPPMGDHPLLRPDRLNRWHFMARQQTATDYHSTAFSGASLGAFTIQYRPRTTTLLGTT